MMIQMVLNPTVILSILSLNLDEGEVPLCSHKFILTQVSSLLGIRERMKSEKSALRGEVWL